MKRDIQKVLNRIERINKIKIILNVVIAILIGVIILVSASFIPSFSVSGVKSSWTMNLLVSLNPKLFLQIGIGSFLILFIVIIVNIWFVKKYKKDIL